MLLLGVIVTSCRKNSPHALLLERKIVFTEASQELIKKLNLSSERLSQEFLTALERSRQVQWFSRSSQRTPPAQGYSIQVDWGMQPLPPDIPNKKIRLQWYVQYRLHPVESGQEMIVIRESKDYSYSLQEKLPKRDDVAHLYRQLWNQGSHSLVAFGKLRQLPALSLMPYLQQNNAYLKRHATLFLGQKQHQPAVPSLIKQLQTQDRDLLLATIGALVRLRSQKAVIPLIQLARQKDGAFLAQILSALGEIGGEEAKSFLFTIASSHSNQALQDTAKEALDELRQREARSTSAAVPLSRSQPDDQRQSNRE